MRVIECNVENFASYKELNFTFNDNALTLIHGATGSGKSTFCDIVPWILFGKTAKGGSVDETLSWGGGIAKGTITVELPSGDTYIVCRTRGKSKDNDLCFFLKGSYSIIATRGKDLIDTQKKINTTLGMDYELYLSGSYFHEFSQTAQFFTTTPKNRRAICEQLVDLALPKKLGDKLTLHNKETKEKLALTKRRLELTNGKIETLEENIKHEKFSVQYFKKDQSSRIKELEEKCKNFGLNQLQKIKETEHRIAIIKVESPKFFVKAIAAIKENLPPKTEPCTECGLPKNNERREVLLSRIQALKQKEIENSYKLREIESLNQQIIAIEETVNVYGERLEELQNQKNPYEKSLVRLVVDQTDAMSSSKELSEMHSSLLAHSADLDVLGAANSDFRGLLIKNTILDIEGKTNVLLSNHFDAEIKIELAIEEADKVDVSITKDGNSCVYTQLSKGQRQLLKLCFGVSVMEAVANHHGINFSQLFLDEATDGLDEENKVKAVKMLETLATSRAVYIVEHSSAIKAMVDNKHKVELIDGHSVINEEA